MCSDIDRAGALPGNGSGANAHTSSTLPAGYIANATLSRDRHEPWTARWSDYEAIGTAAYLHLFPWRWKVRRLQRPLNTTEPPWARWRSDQATTDDGMGKTPGCPRARTILASFAVVNAIVLVGSFMTANRHVVKRLTCGRWGDPGSRLWPLMALLGVALNLLANWWNAMLLRSAHARANAHSGADAAAAANTTAATNSTATTAAAAGSTSAADLPSIGHLVLFWCARPRMAWMIVPLAYLWHRAGRDPTTFVSAAVSSLLAEVVLQLLGATYLGMTVNYARRHGYYLVGRLAFVPRGADALLMYSGALLWLVLVGVGVITAALTYTPLGRLTKDGMKWLARTAAACAAAAWRGVCWLPKRTKEFVAFAAPLWFRTKSARISGLERKSPPPQPPPAPPPTPTPTTQQRRERQLQRRWQQQQEKQQQPQDPQPGTEHSPEAEQQQKLPAIDGPNNAEQRPSLSPRTGAVTDARVTQPETPPGGATGTASRESTTFQPDFALVCNQMGFDDKLMSSLGRLFMVSG
jgi:hypothetical protein